MMALLLVGLLLFPLQGRVSAGGLEEPLARVSACGVWREEYGVLSDGLLRFFVSRKLDGGGFICGALESAISKGCAIGGWSEWSKIAEYCSLEVPSGSYAVGFDSLKGTHGMTGRKILLDLSKNSSSAIEYGIGQRHVKKKYEDPPGSSKEIVVAVPAAFLICCAFLCPCFWKKEMENIDEQPLGHIGMGHLSSSSEDMQNSTRVIGSPLRVPGCSPWEPPSTFRKIAGLSRFATEANDTLHSMQINMKQIRKATQNFSELHVIGEGSLGKVYKAVMPNGLVVAVKRTKKEHFAALREEFRNEVQLLSQIEHQGLVKFIGYIDHEVERILVSEYVPNGTLREHLDGRDGRYLDFRQRLSIAIDVAHALTYLHLYSTENPIIHRDVKSSSILLTESLRAKVAGFGCAKLGPTGEATHVSTALKGTAGYLDPVYLVSYKLTTKSDVFSFGVLLLEIISGRRPVETERPRDERITLKWAFMQEKQGKMTSILDPNLQECVSEEILSRLLQLLFHCAAPVRDDRPTMKEVEEVLWGIRKEYGMRR